jgi:taurine dioxygenase
MPIDVRPIAGSFGAEIGGLDLRLPLCAEDLAALKAAWNRHLVLVIRGQQLTPAQHIRFGRYFGELWPHPLTPPELPDHPEIYVLANLVEGKPDYQPQRADFWHTDLTYTARPSRAGILYARVIPPTGGDTLFANMQRALATLPPGLRERLAKLEAVHGMEGFGARYAVAKGADSPPLPPATPGYEPIPNVTHPVVIRQPETGRPSLFVNRGFTIRLLGLDAAESEALIDELIRHATSEDNLYRHQWQVDDIVIWDNFCTMHCATGGYALPMRRMMHRLTVGGPAVEPALSVH